MARRAFFIVAPVFLLVLLCGCSSIEGGQAHEAGDQQDQVQGASISGVVASPTSQAPSFPEEAFRTGRATEFVGYNVYDELGPAVGMDPNGVAFVCKDGRFFAPIHLYEVADDFKDDRWAYEPWTYDNVPNSYEVRTTADYVNMTGRYATTYSYDVSFGDECLVLDRSEGDDLYVTSKTACSDIQVFDAYCLLPVSDGGTYGGVYSGVIDEVQRVSRDDTESFDAALESLQLEIHMGSIEGRTDASSLLVGNVPQSVTISTQGRDTTVELDRYYVIAPMYHNPIDSGVRVGIKEKGDDYVVLDLSNVEPGRYLVPSYGEGYLLVEIR